MCLKSKLPGHVAGVEARVIQSDVKHSDGHILQVFAPIPLQASLEGALHFLLAIPILIDLQVEKQKRVGRENRVGEPRWGQGRAKEQNCAWTGRKGTVLQGDPECGSRMGGLEGGREERKAGKDEQK